MTHGLSYAPARLSFGGIGAVLLLHGLVLWLLLRTGILQVPIPPAVLEVSLLPTAAPALPRLRPEPPRSRPVERRLPAPQPQTTPLIAAQAEAPAAAAPVATSPIAVPPAPTFPVPATPSTPRFDADYLDNPKPVYPALSRRLGEEGRVVLRVRVAASGLPTEVTLHAGSGSDRLDRAALDAVRRWKFVPARLGDEAVAAAVLVPIVFSLKD